MKRLKRSYEMEMSYGKSKKENMASKGPVFDR